MTDTKQAFDKGQIVDIDGHTCRITGKTAIGKTNGETYFSVEIARLQVNQWGKKAKITGWGNAQWVRESKIKG